MLRFKFIITTTCLFLCALSSAEAQAGHTMILTDSTPADFIGQKISYLVDTTNNLAFAEILSPKYDRQFKQSEQTVPNFGNIYLTVWNKIKIINHSTKNWVLTDLNDNDSLVFYYPDTTGQYHAIYSGTSAPVSSRNYKTNAFVFDLPLQPEDTATFYLKVKTRNCEYALMVLNYHQFIGEQFKRVLAKGIYFGLVLLLIFYNLAMFIAVRDRTYIFYIFYVLFTALLIGVLSGIYPYLLQDSLHAFWNFGPIITALGGIFLALFSTSFLQLYKRAYAIYAVITYLFIPLLCINIFLTLTGNELKASVLNQLIGPIGLLTLVASAIYIYKKGYKPARYYLLACSFYFVGVVIYVLKVWAVLPYNFLTSNSMEMGSAMEIAFFSLSLADRINIFRKEKIATQSELINTLQEKTALQHQMLQLEARMLRSQMNPHFIFNCMNSIKALVNKNQQQEALNYLSTFSKFLRTTLQNADKTDITLNDELEICKLYLELESLRLGNKFSYQFLVENTPDLKSILVPALFLQPFIENALWHGIMPMNEPGVLKVIVKTVDDTICCMVDDNGVGRQQSLMNKQRIDGPKHQSKGVTLTQSRLDLDSTLNNRDAEFKIIDKTDGEGRPSGTTVIITFKES